MSPNTIILISESDERTAPVMHELQREYGLKEVSLEDLKSGSVSSHSICKCSSIIDLDQLNALGYPMNIKSYLFCDPYDAACRIFDEACDFFFQETSEVEELAYA